MPNIIFIILAILAIIIAVHYRTTMLGFYGFYEPDGFYYFTAMRAIVNNGFQFPSVLGISGWPQHQPIAEAHGIYYITLIPYVLLGGKVSYYTIMRLSPVLFGLLDMLGAYLLSRYISRDKLFGALVLVFVALSMGNAARTSALVYRGDSFVTFFLLIALVFLLETIKQDGQKKKAVMAVAASVSLLFCNLVWNGSPFAVATYMFAFMILLSYAFIFRKEKLIDDCKYLLFSLILWFILVNLVKATGFITAQQLTGPEFISIWVLLAVFWAFAYYATSVSVDFIQAPEYRILILGFLVVIGAVVFALVEPATVYNIFVGNGFVASGNIATTTQELQAPSCQFLYTSFGANMFTSVPTLVMFISSLTGSLSSLQCTAPAAGNLQWIWTSFYGILGIILLFPLFIPYMFMQVYDSGGLLSGKARLRFDATPGMIILMALFILTAYLEMHVIRFNSLVSVPLAMLSAFTLYWLVLLANGINIAAPVGRAIGLTIMLIVIVFVLYELVYYANVYSSTLVQADSINPQFIGALRWLKANSPTNSVVLTLWPDGSVVEGVANRTSVTDSVGSENGTKATPFAAWLFNTSDEPNFLTNKKLTGMPNYLLVRSTWLAETQGIYTEANISVNSSLFGYAPLVSFSESAVNSTFRQIELRPNPNGQYPSVLLSLSYSNSTGQLTGLYGLLEVGQGQVSPFQQVVLYNQDNGNFSDVNQGKINQTNGEMLLVQYSGVPRQGFFLNITGAFVFGEAIANSNFIKMLYLCNDYQCAWNNSVASMHLVYMNQDTKIFRIDYNSTG